MAPTTVPGHLLAVLVTVLLPLTVPAKIIDLSHDHGPDTIMSPHVPHFNRSTIFQGDYLPGIFVEGGKYFSGEHGGTHMDAPVHFKKNGMRLHQVPLESTIAEGVMIDCSEEGKEDKMYLVPLEKLKQWEKKNGKIPMEAAVIFNFGWSEKFSNKPLYVGSEIDDQWKYVFPAVSKEAGMWLYNERKAKIIATDTMTPDPFTIGGKKVKAFPIHSKFLPNNRLIIENLKDTHKLPATGFRFHAAPVKYVGSTGAQVRAYAMTYEKQGNGGVAVSRMGGFYVLTVLVVFAAVLQF